MSLLPKDLNGCPFLLLAPMEGLGDRSFRKAIASVGGFDEAVMEFIRVPCNAHIPSLAREYQPRETDPIPLIPQLMGSDPELMAEMARAMESMGAPRIDLNCGCPSKTVTGRGAGSSLLKDPKFLYEVASAMSKAVSVPFTIKMRSGFNDTSLFRENLLAAQESGAKFITLHPRTKVDGYGPPARWDLIAEAKSLLKIPVVGNGDILKVEDALRMLAMTGCDGIMIGRGCVINPFIFHQIRALFAGKEWPPSYDSLVAYLERYFLEQSGYPEKTQVNKLKQLLGFLFKSNEGLLLKRQSLLTTSITDPRAFLDHAKTLLKEHFSH